MKLAIIGSTGLVGSQLANLAGSRGHVVTGVSKDSGVDLVTGTGLDDVLGGVDTVVNVIQSPNFEQEASTKFFTTVAANLGKAAASAGVSRTVALSIIGVDRVAAAERDAGTGYDGYYKAKFAQEQATREHSPGAHVVRSAQFHDIARQAIDWGATATGRPSPISRFSRSMWPPWSRSCSRSPTALETVTLSRSAVRGPSTSRPCQPCTRATRATPYRSSPVPLAKPSATAFSCPVPVRFSWDRPSTSGWLLIHAPELHRR